MSRSIAIVSGKGGVGKTVLAVALGQAMAELGKRTLVVDGALGLANIDVQLGLCDDRHLGLAVAGRALLPDLVLREPASGIDLLLGPSGWQGLAELRGAPLDRLAHEIGQLAQAYDACILDAGSGIAAPTLTLAGLADETVVVVTDEATALTDAYAMIKLALRDRRGLSILVNQATSATAGRDTYEKLRRTCRRFLEIDPPLAGIVRADRRVGQAVSAQRPLLARHPNSEAAEDVRRIARDLMTAARRPEPVPG